MDLTRLRLISGVFQAIAAACLFALVLKPEWTTSRLDGSRNSSIFRAYLVAAVAMLASAVVSFYAASRLPNGSAAVGLTETSLSLIASVAFIFALYSAKASSRSGASRNP